MAVLLSLVNTFDDSQLESLIFTIHDYLLIRVGSPMCKTRVDCVEVVAYLVERLHELSGEAQGVFRSMCSTVILLISDAYGVTRNARGLRLSYGFARSCSEIICAYLEMIDNDVPLATDIFSLAITMWLEDRSPYSRERTSTTALTLMLSRYKVTNARTRRHVLTESITEPRRVAMRIVRRLVDIIDIVSTDFEHLRLHLFVVELFFEDRVIASCLLQKDIVGILCLAMMRLTVSPCGPDHHKCLSILMQTFDTVFSFSLRAFSAALEQDMLETTAWLYYRMLDRCCDHELLHYLSIKRTFFEIFSKYLISEISIKQMLGARHRLRSSPVYDLFSQHARLEPCFQLDHFLLSRMINIRLFAFLDSNDLRKCDNVSLTVLYILIYWLKVNPYKPSCRQKELRKKLSECTHCADTVYCNRRCQSQHWRDFGHMYDCRATSKFASKPSLYQLIIFEVLG